MDKCFLENLKTNANYSNKVFLISNKSNFRNIVNIKHLSGTRASSTSELK
jgi:hypothetical protein